jgi:hypothetical protein
MATDRQITNRFVRFDETTWPLADLDLAWRLTFAPKTITQTDRLYLAAVLNAYAKLANCGRPTREDVCRQLRRGIKAMRKRNGQPAKLK